MMGGSNPDRRRRKTKVALVLSSYLASAAACLISLEFGTNSSLTQLLRSPPNIKNLKYYGTGLLEIAEERYSNFHS